MASIGQGEYPKLPEIKLPLSLGGDLPVPVLKGQVTWNDGGMPSMRDVGRALLPEKVENWFLGNKKDEELLNKYSDSDIPTYKEISNNYKNGLYNAEDVKKFADLRVKYDTAKANREYTNVRNANIGQGIVDIGSAAIGGGGAAATKAGINMIKPFVGKKIAQGITQGALGGGLGGLVHGVGTGLVQENVNPVTQGLVEGGIGTVLGGGLGYGIGKIGQNVALKGIRNNVDDVLRQQQYFDDYIEGLSNNSSLGEQSLLNKEFSKLRTAREGLRPRATTAEGAFDILVDENGNPINFYHSTPNAGFTDFNPGSYFTKNLEYSKGYMHPSASALGVKKTANNPGTYEVNLDFNNTFDTRNPIAKDIFNKEYQAYYSPELSERGLPDWMEAEDLMEWLQNKHPEYDSLIVDEGGVGGGVFGGQPVVLHGESYIPFNSDQVLIKNLESEKPVDLFEEIIKRDNWHKKQSNLIKKTNPMLDEYHTGIRSSKDIKTPEEVFNVENFAGTPDFKYSDAVKARRDGFIKVYSSKPINEGGFVTPSKMEAQSYLGNGEHVHEAIIPIKDVAWIDSIEGQYAPITHTEYGLSNTPLKFTGKTVKIKGKIYQELDLSKSDYRSVLDGFNNHLSKKARKQLEIEKNIKNSKFYIVNDGFNEPIVTWEELIDKKAN